MRRYILIVFAIIGLIGVYIGYGFYRSLFEANISEIGHNQSIYVHTDIFSEDLIDTLISKASLIRNEDMKRAATAMKWKEEGVKPGHYVLKDGMTNRDVINMFRSGNQTPVQVTVENVRTISELCQKVTAQLLMDSAQLYDHILSNAFLQDIQLEENALMTFFIPNTYEMYWTTDNLGFTERMAKESENFWSETRMSLAKDQNLSPEEVYTLASIVEKESNAVDELPTIAGLYLNRLRNGIPLQADPTVVFANGDFGIKRVLNKHLTIESPYNTYKYPGLPPGPICMPSMRAIQAVLEPERHNYLFMCARPDNSGKHAFATNLTQHNRNARNYQQWLNSRGIR